MIASLVTFHYQERASLSSGEPLAADAECEPGGGAEDRGQGDGGGEGGGGHRGGQGGPVQQEPRVG